MRELFRWFYCLPIGEAVILVGFATVLYLLLHQWPRVRRAVKAVDVILLIGWLGAVIYATIGQRSGDSDSTAVSLQLFHSYREVWNGGNVELYRSNFMNMMLFYPAGLVGASLLPKKWPGWSRCILVAAVFAAMSAGIEFLQYRYALGQCEIDDVFHNTTGALLGCLVALLSAPVCKHPK